MEEKKQFRTAKLICIIGTNGTGKTTMLQTFANAELERNGRVLIITPHDTEWNKFNNVPIPYLKDFKTFEGIGKVHFTDDLKLLKTIEQTFEKGLLVLDDSSYFIKPNIDRAFKQILISRRQMSCDVIVSAHSLADIPPSVFFYDPTFILKRTTSSFESRKKNINADLYQRLLEAQSRINKNKNNYYYELIKS